MAKRPGIFLGSKATLQARQCYSCGFVTSSRDYLKRSVLLLDYSALNLKGSYGSEPFSPAAILQLWQRNFLISQRNTKSFSNNEFIEAELFILAFSSCNYLNVKCPTVYESVIWLYSIFFLFSQICSEASIMERQNYFKHTPLLRGAFHAAALCFSCARLLNERNDNVWLTKTETYHNSAEAGLLDMTDAGGSN